MSKRYTNMQLKEIISYMMSLGYTNMSSLGEQLAKLNITPEEIKENNPDSARLKDASLISSVMTIVADILHPGFNISKQLMPKKFEPFILNVEAQYANAKKNGLTSKNCPCCKEVSEVK